VQAIEKVTILRDRNRQRLCFTPTGVRQQLPEKGNGLHERLSQGHQID